MNRTNSKSLREAFDVDEVGKKRRIRSRVYRDLISAQMREEVVNIQVKVKVSKCLVSRAVLENAEIADTELFVV